MISTVADRCSSLDRRQRDAFLAAQHLFTLAGRRQADRQFAGTLRASGTELEWSGRREGRQFKLFQISQLRAEFLAFSKPGASRPQPASLSKAM